MNNLSLLMAQAQLQGWIYGITGAVFVLLLLQVKHLVVDFFFQPPYMWKNKGKLFHLGGWSHAGLHGLATALILMSLISGYRHQILILCGLEVLAHFFIDFAKVRILSWTGWRPETSPRYWYLLGVDQFFHQLCYLVLVLVWLTTP